VKDSLALVTWLVLAAGCKTDSPAPTAGSAATPAPATESSRPSRSGKIDLPPRRPPAGGSDTELPALPDDSDLDARREEFRALREQRRKERQELVDTNKDGTISPEEMAAARKVRAEEMRSRFDADGDGKLTPAELGESRMTRRMGDPAELDTDKNGDITSAELEASMEKMRERMRERGGPGAPDGPGRGGWGRGERGSGSATP